MQIPIFELNINYTIKMELYFIYYCMYTAVILINFESNAKMKNEEVVK